ncbi:HIT domain-containing protein [Marinobacter sp. X15-166B]|uniref:HIT domain-containing protein n=1 Tax=Marinobacter sp. X15-166B TaxID=1897620 RepID=UPI00085BD07E|nr:HIT family protein [Marinobacter sp. X15-166B]OEY67241.1 histidine triad (HIT) protein [Marinobacter sp. X15-166B]
MAQSYRLHDRLQADTVGLGVSALCDIRLMNDATWPWVILVPRRPAVRESYELADADQVQLMRESAALGRALMAHFGGDKLNVAALGNVVPQLHVHHIVRFNSDPAWPAPVWGKQPVVPYGREALTQRIAELSTVVQAVQAV